MVEKETHHHEAYQHPEIVISLPNLAKPTPNGPECKVSFLSENEGLANRISRIIERLMPKGHDMPEPKEKRNSIEYSGVPLAVADAIVREFEPSATDRPISALIMSPVDELAKNPVISLNNVKSAFGSKAPGDMLALALRHGDGFNHFLDTMKKACRVFNGAPLPLEINNPSAGYSIVVIPQNAFFKLKEQTPSNRQLENFLLAPAKATHVPVPAPTHTSAATQRDDGTNLKPVRLMPTSTGNYIVTVTQNASDEIEGIVEMSCVSMRPLADFKGHRLRANVSKADGDKLLADLGNYISLVPNPKLEGGSITSGRTARAPGGRED